MNGVKHGHGELLEGALKKKEEAKQKTRVFTEKRINKGLPRTQYSTIHNRLSFINLPLLTKCGTALKSVPQIFMR